MASSTRLPGTGARVSKNCAPIRRCWSTATTLRWKNGKVSLTDGPYAETKEQLGGILILEARDLNHAIQLMSKHPGVKAGPFEIRPALDMSEMMRESEKRRAGNRETTK